MRELGDRVASNQMFRRDLFYRAFEAIFADASWDRGLGLLAPSTGLRPSNVCTDSSDDRVTWELKVDFEYIERVNHNPPSPAVPGRSCSRRSWGFCSEDVWFQTCMVRGLQHLRHTPTMAGEEERYACSSRNRRRLLRGHMCWRHDR